MEESVQCGECGNRYDSNVNAFCPRCGSLPRARDVSHAVQSAGRSDPSLRRVRSAGVVLMILGGMALAWFLVLMVAPPEPTGEDLAVLADVDAFASQPGGDLSVRVLSGGEPAEVPVLWLATNGTVLQNTTSVGGWFNATAPVAFSNLTVGAGDGAQVHNLYVAAGTRLSVTVDLAEPQEEPAWHATDLAGVFRTLLVLLSFLALVVLGGGLAAWRQRVFGLAVTGAAVATLPGVLVLVVLPLQGLVLLLPGAIALAFLVAGRRHFRRA